MMNWYGLWTLYLKEVRRFLVVYHQSILGPLFTALFFYFVFESVARGAQRNGGDLPYQEFLISGLIMMAVINNTFSQSASTLVMAKLLKNLVDLLVVPISPFEITLAFVGAAITRGFVNAFAVGVVLYLFHPFELLHLWSIIFYLVAASSIMSCVGLLCGFWADKFDDMAAISNFVIMPLTFMSGVFYSIHQFPQAWQNLFLFNPVFYLIDGFRYSLLGYTEGSLFFGLSATLALSIGLFCLVYHLFKTGYKIRT